MDDVIHSHGGQAHGGIPHVHASVDHLANEFGASARLAVRLDAALMQKLGLAEDSFVRIATDRGRSIVVRLDPPMDADKGSGIIRLDRFVRQALKAHLNEEVEIEKAELGPAKRKIGRAHV